MKLLPWIGLAGLLYFFLKPEEVEAAAPPPGNDVDTPVGKASFLEGKTIGVQPIANPCQGCCYFIARYLLRGCGQRLC
mgnify:CR=1 FL=1